MIRLLFQHPGKKESLVFQCASFCAFLNSFRLFFCWQTDIVRTEAVKNMKIYSGLRVNGSVILGQAVFILSSQRHKCGSFDEPMDKTFN